MNRYLIYIIASIMCILIPVVAILYGLWDSHQPKIGPVGDGKPNNPTWPQWIPLASCFVLGVINLPVAIIRYRRVRGKRGRGT